MSEADDYFDRKAAEDVDPDEEARAEYDAETEIILDLIDGRISPEVLAEHTKAWDDDMLTDLYTRVAEERPMVLTRVKFDGKMQHQLGIMRRVLDLESRDEADRIYKERKLGVSESETRTVDGASFILDLPDDVPCLWGSGSQVVWAEGEAVMLVGSPGVGKTTIAGQVLRARLVGGKVLGMPVEETNKKVLYLAMDRPQQIARALARQLSDVPREVLETRLVIWQGPPVADVALNPDLLLQMAHEAGADTVFVDSLKDAALGLSNDEAGAGYNRARQLCLAAGVSLFELHHMKKQGGGTSGKASRPTKLEDVYGSVWLTAGAGSVVLLHGEAGDGVVEWKHLKQPAEPVGPFTIEHDHLAGVSEISIGTDPYDYLHDAGAQGISAKELAVKWLGSGDHTTTAGKNNIAKARRKLDSWVRKGQAVCISQADPSTSRPARYAASTFGSPGADFSENDGG